MSTPLPSSNTPLVDFVVDISRIQHFARLVRRSFSECLAEEAEELRTEIVRSWTNYLPHASATLTCFHGLGFGGRVQVSVFPPTFNVGAVHTNHRLVIFGQPLRRDCFATAVLVHEMVHILLFTSELNNSMINEILCFSAEAEIYRQAEQIGILEVWKLDEVDRFHAAALVVAAKLPALRDTSYLQLASEAQQILDPDTLALMPPVGLLRNLSGQE